MAAIHPFADGNGRTARALATLVLYQRGFDFKRLFASGSQTNCTSSSPATQKIKDYQTSRQRPCLGLCFGMTQRRSLSPLKKKNYYEHKYQRFRK
ncbi:MAG: hypothetical protein COX44_02460 [Candidatus Portnoybacteria bacterium CG23_combo_of_CG06-09_8_20_14_all_37_13]|uniref:Fido domain-containing protein n=1 Tax=Candidatus Portnoybacteria bacterium CG23_combo_of_CG06-09_8_20_14_all_37_13 TaxID=1974819 RepID=A0A2G9YCM0_9BACT|nr:MAG: hypothetical protein COX44_02460 [Candidatus Portnoybacteria bacterium CG23_combo_of_CG06-09_8_20_14_all_37_13]